MEIHEMVQRQLEDSKKEMNKHLSELKDEITKLRNQIT